MTGKATSVVRCNRCNRKLTNHASIKVGIGKTCAKKAQQEAKERVTNIVKRDAQ